MRLPWGELRDIYSTFLHDTDFVVMGCLSFEERCCTVPQELQTDRCQAVELIEVLDPPDAYPDYSAEIKVRTDQYRQLLNGRNILFHSVVSELLIGEDQLIDIINGFTNRVPSVPTIVLDITSLPKRYFCFFVKRLLLQESFRNVIVTYTQPALGGYTSSHLAEDPMTYEHLPGYGSPLPPSGATMIVSVGFESLGIKPLLEIYSSERKQTRIIMAFPPNGENIKRQWSTLKQMVTDPQEIRGNIEIIAGWDAEQVYNTLEQWRYDTDGLTLAPFGPKPHSLGMTLFAIKFDSGLYYTQPKSYNPSYSTGQGTTWAYVVKWDGIACFDRSVRRM